MTKGLRTIWIVLLLFCCCFPAAYAMSVAPPHPIVIGAIFDLGEPGSALNTYSARGAMLAVAEINAAGGVLGRGLELRLDPNQTQATSRQIAENFATNKNIVAVIGLSDSATALQVIPTLAAHNKLFIISGATSPGLVNAAPGWVFLASFSDDEQAYTAAKFATQKLNSRKALVVLQTDSPYTRALSQFFEGYYQKMGGKIINYGQFTANQSNLANQLTSLRSQVVLPDIIYLAVSPEASGKIIQQIRKAGFLQPILASSNLDASDLSLLPAKLPGTIYFTTHAFTDVHNPNPHMQQFIKQYQATYNQPPDHSFAALGYDTVQLLSAAIARAKSTDPVRIRNALLQLHNFVGVSGIINYSDSPIPDKSITLIRFQEGQWSLAEQY